MGLKLYNTLSRSKQDFAPIEPPKARIYTCGPTVYNHQHVGNYRTYVFEDILKRVLRYLGFKVLHVMNITDVGHLTSQADEGEDKMEVGAAREGKTAWEIAEFYTRSFKEDCRALNILPPDVLCKATDHIKEQIELIERLEKKGLTYRIKDGLYYDTSRFKDYGRLMGEGHLEGSRAGARVEANPEKRQPADFALWKLSPPGGKRQMEWDSPWGKGFPGWHIECSAMAMRYLGESFDIHCGGVDHIPIHHTNEIAQSEGATGKPFARFWLHGEFLLMGQAKMAKSEGGFITLRHLKEKGIDPLDYRYHCLSAHYRKQLEFSWEALEAAKTARRRLKESVRGLSEENLKPACAEHETALKQALMDDLNVPAALAAAWESVRDEKLPAGSRLAMANIAENVFGLGLFQEEAPEELPKELSDLLERRKEARAKKDYDLSDTLRQELFKKGILVEDGPSGQRWRRK